MSTGKSLIIQWLLTLVGYFILTPEQKKEKKKLKTEWLKEKREREAKGNLGQILIVYAIASIYSIPHRRRRSEVTLPKAAFPGRLHLLGTISFLPATNHR